MGILRPYWWTAIAFVTIAVLVFPQFRSRENIDLDAVSKWGLHGPGKDLPLPFMGVYLFKGLNPFLLCDLSYAYDWNPIEHSFMFDFSQPGAIYAEDGLDSGEWAPTSKSTGSGPHGVGTVSGWLVARVIAFIRLRVKFVFKDDTLTVAEVPPSLFGIPADWLGPIVFKAMIQEIRKGRDGMWLRNNLDPLTRQRTSGYALLPLFTIIKPGDAPKLNAKTLELAKQKLNNSSALRWV